MAIPLPYLYYYYKCKSECTMNRLGLSDIISERGSVLGGGSRFMRETASMIVFDETRWLDSGSG
jgi:hypothetical protein